MSTCWDLDVSLHENVASLQDPVCGSSDGSEYLPSKEERHKQKRAKHQKQDEHQKHGKHRKHGSGRVDQPASPSFEQVQNGLDDMTVRRFSPLTLMHPPCRTGILCSTYSCWPRATLWIVSVYHVNLLTCHASTDVHPCLHQQRYSFTSGRCLSA